MAILVSGMKRLSPARVWRRKPSQIHADRVTSLAEAITMGLFDSLESMATTAMENSGSDQTKVAGGLVQALQEHPGGLSSVLDTLRSNGMGEHADAIQNGDAPATTPDQVETGLQGSGLLESVAEKAGVSPEVAKVALATVLPVVLAHFSQNGGQAGGEGALGGCWRSLCRRSVCFCAHWFVATGGGGSGFPVAPCARYVR
jgi:uncharacterized protein YidB (DUF937 family)